MILTLILAADTSDRDRACVNRHESNTAVWVGGAPYHGDMATWLATRPAVTTIHVIRTDRWQYDEHTIEALRKLATLVALIDPTGLLGDQTSGIPPELRAKRTITDSPPIGSNLRGSGGRNQPAARHKPQPTRRYNG